MSEQTTSAAVVVRDDLVEAPELREVPLVEKPLITSAQAKIDAVASVTMSAYQKASQLSLSAEEINALKADFPDEAFKPGAAGKENLIYIEHAFLRDRLDQVLGMGQWALVPRNRWAEPFKTNAGKDGSRVYFEGMLMVRGCFVAEAIGEMEYYPHNASQNYGDAVEGAESACLRRLCKKWGIGLQAWKKDWCEGWWQRKRQKPAGRSEPPSTSTPFKKVAPSPAAAPAKAATSDVLPRNATATTREWFLKEMGNSSADFGELLSWAREINVLLPIEGLSDWPLDKVPTSKQALAETLQQFIAWQKKNVQPPEEPWRSVPIPKWSKHVKEEGFKTFGDLPKAKLWWWCTKWIPVGDSIGKVSPADFELRQMLDEVREHYNFDEGEDRPEDVPTEYD